jgi:uncharacterized membrane protein
MSRWRNYWYCRNTGNRHPKYTFGGDTRPPIPVLSDRRFVRVNAHPPLIYNPIGEIKGTLYLGTGAGKHLLGDIKRASQSVKIVSPYISDKLLNVLLQKKSASSCFVSLVTTEGKPTTRDPIGQEHLIRSAIKQNAQTDEIASSQKRKRMQITANLLLVLITLLIVGTALFLYFLQSLLKNYNFFFLCTSAEILTFVVILFLCSRQQSNRMVQVRSYTYQVLFPFKILCDNVSAPRLHEKLYVIDDRIAYVGSLNFTESGCERNLEACVKIQNSEAVVEISKYCDALMSDKSLPYYSLEDFRAVYFTENYY